MGDFRRLKVWKAAYVLAREVYVATRGFPVEERFGLADQLRRAAVSIGANIAEGCGRNSDPDFARFLRIALGSANELCYLIQLATDLEFISDPMLLSRAESVRRMLAVLLSTVRAAS